MVTKAKALTERFINFVRKPLKFEVFCFSGLREWQVLEYSLQTNYTCISHRTELVKPHVNPSAYKLSTYQLDVKLKINMKNIGIKKEGRKNYYYEKS